MSEDKTFGRTRCVVDNVDEGRKTGVFHQVVAGSGLDAGVARQPVHLWRGVVCARGNILLCGGCCGNDGAVGFDFRKSDCLPSVQLRRESAVDGGHCQNRAIELLPCRIVHIHNLESDPASGVAIVNWEADSCKSFFIKRVM